MSLLINIDTAQETAFVCISENGKPLFFAENLSQKDHAFFLHAAIADLIKKSGISMQNIDAIAVTNGPGSYTGLRVGMSTAKGLSYTLQKPLITVGSLEMMAYDIKNNISSSECLLCPMIDARRMEVFTAIYNWDLSENLSPAAMILEPQSFAATLNTHKIFFTGSGSYKFQQILNHPNAVFLQPFNLSLSLCWMAHENYKSKIFDDIVSAEPNYIKPYKAF